MVNQVISVNRRKYAVGLFWQPVGAGFVPRVYARSLARSIDKKLNLYVQYRSMVALGSKKMGQRAGMPSAAAEVLESASEYTSFLAVFKTGTKFYLVAVRNGVVLEDALFDSDAAARARYAKLSEIPDWSAFIAPGEWGMPRAIERDLSKMITGGAHATLRPIGRARAVAFSIALTALFCMAVFALFRQPIAQMMSPRPQIAQIDPELAAEYKRRIEETNRALDEQFEIEKQPAPEPLVLPYETLPQASARAALCYQAIGFLMQPVAGWNQVSAKCGETHASTQFRRDFGTLVDFYEIAGGLMPGAFVREMSENTLDVSARLPKLETYTSQDERDPQTVVRDVTSAFQAIGADVETNIVFDTLSNGVETAVVNVVEVGAQSKLTPVQFIKIFDDFGGVYMTACEWDALRRIWNYEVIIYAK